ncbi:MAG: hypothetical protein ACKV2T_37490 [Kofleriaceae bacterium]
MGTWGAGPLENDAALDYAGDQCAALVATIEAFLDAPVFELRFAPAYAALELLNVFTKHTPTSPPVAAEIDRWKAVFLAAIDREIVSNPKDAKFERTRRKALKSLLAALAARSIDFHGGAPGEPSSALSRLLSRAARTARQRGTFTVNYADLIRWVEPYGEDVERAWSESTNGDWMFEIASVLRVSSAALHEIVAEALEPQFARLPADAPALGDPIALETWATAAVGRKERAGLAIAAIARAAAHLARAVAKPEDHLSLAVRNLLDGAALDAALCAANAGMDWMSAMAGTDGPGWTARHKANLELAELLRVRLPASELKLQSSAPI